MFDLFSDIIQKIVPWLYYTRLNLNSAEQNILNRLSIKKKNIVENGVSCVICFKICCHGKKIFNIAT